MASIALIGLIDHDRVIHLDRLPSPGGSAVVSRVTESPGGTTANTAVALARLGERVTLRALVGCDSEGERLIQGLAREGIDTESITIADGPTDASWILLDTRSGSPLGSGVPRVLLVPPTCEVPVDAKGLALNLTVVSPTALGHVVAYPADVPVPATSNLNFSAGQTRANNAVVRLDGDGEIAFLATVGGGGTVHLIVDVVGYFE